MIGQGTRVRCSPPLHGERPGAAVKRQYEEQNRQLGAQLKQQAEECRKLVELLETRGCRAHPRARWALPSPPPSLGHLRNRRAIFFPFLFFPSFFS